MPECVKKAQVGQLATGLATADSSLLQMPIELGVKTTFCNQLLMITVFCNASTIEYQHPVCLFYRRQAMGDD